MQKLSCIIPCYNEEAALPYFLQEIRKVADNMSTTFQLDFEILFINDGSRDKTLQILRQAAQEDKRIRYISFARNFGKEAAMYAGFQNCTGDYAVVMDADLQHPPAMLADMYRALTEEHYDIAAARRVDRKGEPAINALLEMKEYNRFSKGIFGWIGFKTKWIPYENVERVAGETTWSFWNLLLYSLEGFVAFTTIPLSIASVMGIAFCIIALLWMVGIILKTLIFGDPVAGFPTLACLLLLIGGSIQLSLGIIGQYLAKTYLETKQRPIYIVQETEEACR